MARNFNAQIRFRYDQELDTTYLLVRFPGEDFFTKIGSKPGVVTRTEANTIVTNVAQYMADKGYTISVEGIN